MKSNFTETYDFLVSILANAPFGIVTIDLDGYITMCNKMALVNLEIDGSTKRVIEKPLIKFIKHLPKLQKKVVNCIKKGRNAFDLKNVKLNNKFLNIRGREILNGMIISIADITEAKEIERKMIAAMLEGQENERRRLAKEIHDGVGTLLSALKLNMDGIIKEMDVSSEKLANKLENVEELIQTVSSDVRSISHALMPGALKDFGLLATLENFVLKTDAVHDIQVQLFSKGMENRLPENIELGLFRITQELVNNALKYAEAKNITIKIIKNDKLVALTVEDDGKGFDKSEIENLIDTGIGLRNIKSRAESMHGTFRIDTNSGKGVNASIEIRIFDETKEELELRS